MYALPEGERAELIDGEMHMMAPLSTSHQRVVKNCVYQIENYIRNNNGSCEVFPAPFAVYLEESSNTYVEPDISVICDKDKLDDVVTVLLIGLLRLYLLVVERWIITKSYLNIVQQESESTGLLIK